MQVFAPMARHTVILRDTATDPVISFADNGCQRIGREIRAHGQIARKVAERRRRTPAIMPTTGPEQHADRRIAQEAEADTQVGRQLDRQTEHPSVTLIAMSSAVTARQRVDFSSRSERTKIFGVLDIERHLLIKFIRCLCDLGKCLNSCNGRMRPQYAARKRLTFRP